MATSVKELWEQPTPRCQRSHRLRARDTAGPNLKLVCFSRPLELPDGGIDPDFEHSPAAGG